MIPYSVLCLLSRSTFSSLSLPLAPALFFPRVLRWVVERSYPPPPLPFDGWLRLTSPAPSQVFLFIFVVARVPLAKSQKSAHAALCSRLVACHRCNRGRELSGPRIEALGKAWRIKFRGGSITLLTDFHGKGRSPEWVTFEDRTVSFASF